jgi:myo-inositol-1-phosphate synthase
MEGTTFGDVPLNLEMKLEVWDSPNSAGIVIDAVRCAKLGLDHGLKGALIAPSSYFKKSPPYQFPDDVCRRMVEAFIADPRATEQQLARQVAERPGKAVAKPAKARAGKPSLNGGTNGTARAARATKRRRRKAAVR